MRKTKSLWLLPLLLAVVFLGCPTNGGNNNGEDPTAVELTAGSPATADSTQTQVNVTFTGTEIPAALATSDFQITASDTTLAATAYRINAVTTAADKKSVTVDVRIPAKTDSGSRTFTVKINPDSKLVRGTATVTITQNGTDVAARKVLTTDQATVDVDAAALSATAVFKFGTAQGEPLEKTDFTIDPSSTEYSLNIEGDVVTITVTLTPNTSEVNTKTTTVGIASSSTKVTGTATVKIIQGLKGDEREILTAGASPVFVEAAAITATVVFNGKAGLTLVPADFAVTNGSSSITGVTEDATTAGQYNVVVGFTANASTNYLEKIVSIAPTSTNIKGSAEVKIIQESGKTFGVMNFEGLTADLESDPAPGTHFTGGDYWVEPDGVSAFGTGAGAIMRNVLKIGTDPDANNVFRVWANGINGGRGTQLNFKENTGSKGSFFTRHGIKFDWNPGLPAGSTSYGQVSIRDEDGKAIISFFIQNDGAIKYRVGTDSSGSGPLSVPDAIALINNNDKVVTIPFPDLGSDAVVGTYLNKWYTFEVVFDTYLKTVDLKISTEVVPDNSSPAADQTPEFKEIYNETRIAAAGEYNESGIAIMRIFANRSGGNMWWTSLFDNIQLFREERIAPPPTKEPNAVTELSVVLSAGEANFTWALSNGAESYQFFFAEDDAAYTTPDGVVAAPANTYTLTSDKLAANKAYKAKVVAVNVVGEATGTAKEITFNIGNPGEVDSLKFADASYGEVVLSWTPTLRAEGYKVFVAAAGAYGTTETVKIEDGEGKTAVVTGLTDGTSYSAKVIAYNSLGNALGTPNEVTFTPVKPAYTRAFPIMRFEDTAAKTEITGAPFTSIAGGIIGAATNAMSISVEANRLRIGNPSNNVLRISQGAQSSSRGSQLNLPMASGLAGGKHGITFDVRPGINVVNATWNHRIAINDGITANPALDILDNSYITFDIHRNAPVSGWNFNYVLGHDINAAGVEIPYQLGTANGWATIGVFNETLWYRYNVVIDMDNNTIEVSIINLETGAEIFNLPATALGTPASGTYSGNIASIRVYNLRDAAVSDWAPEFDNIEAYKFD